VKRHCPVIGPRVAGRLARATPALAIVALVVACGGKEQPAKPPPPPAPPPDPPALGKIAQACVRLSACTRAPDAARFRDPSACVDWWLADSDPNEPLRKCLAQAQGCEQVSTCMRGGGDARAAAFCVQRPGVVSGCDGDRLVSCGEDDAHESIVTDCAAIGASCREVKSAAGLVVRACWSAQKCPAGAPEMRCDGPGSIVSCRDGAYERIACRPGTTCIEKQDEMGDPTASCELLGHRRCDVRGARYCENDRLVECERSGPSTKTVVTDCVGFGLRCSGLGPRAGCYVPSNVECDKDMMPRCDGGALVFCAAGRLQKIPCAGIGLDRCDPAAKGSMAACAPRRGSEPSPQAAGK
jgi:hypothetical protein